MKNFQKWLIKHWWILIPTLPFAIMFLLHISIALGNYFNININVPNIEASDWFMFFGSYLGGTIALIGVVITIKHSHQLHNHQINIQYLQKEQEVVAEAISNLPINQTLNIMGIYATGIWIDDNAVEHSKENIREIYSCQTMITLSQIKLSTLSNIISDYSICSKCKEQCELKSIGPEFNEVYNTLVSAIDECLKYLYEYIRSRDASMRYSEMLKKNLSCLENNEPKVYTNSDLEKEKNSTRDRSNIFDDFQIANNKLLELRNTSLPRLITLHKSYFIVRQKNCSKKCFEDWKGGQQ